MGVCFRLIEQDMLEGPWVRGENYSIADPDFFTAAQWLEGDGVDPASVPCVVEHRERMAQRPAVQRALKEEGLGSVSVPLQLKRTQEVALSAIEYFVPLFAF